MKLMMQHYILMQVECDSLLANLTNAHDELAMTKVVTFLMRVVRVG